MFCTKISQITAATKLPALVFLWPSPYLWSIMALKASRMQHHVLN
ncbi:hypothetical protein M758_5G068800 [Ceratodon purpureus]|uniref:Uncharacterized protein n=1 Tax=Ceratodon purpureus TaxID=3225 RepID=A0A8T0HZH2_CERPU|nr:hypothetical protein KC19_5G069100 [Ceratodon purpureus]KAG0615813.1 hypothetical protein M758_5G068800 [Ceratodon purpureus]